MVICPDCGKDVPESRFCKNCGAYIKDVKPIVESEVVGFCSECGGELEKGNKFCPECGTSTADAEEAEQIAQSEAVEESGEVQLDDSDPVHDDGEVSLESDALEDVPIEQADDGESDDSKDNNVPVPIMPNDIEVSSKSDDVEDDSGSDRKIKFCFNCGNKLIGDFKFCPECGQDLSDDDAKSQAPTSSGEKNILLAVILSVLLPGLGQIYLGLDHKGAIFLIAYVISAILILILIGFLLCFVIWIWALIDTIISTNALNRGDEVKDKIL